MWTFPRTFHGCVTASCLTSLWMHNRTGFATGSIQKENGKEYSDFVTRMLASQTVNHQQMLLKITKFLSPKAVDNPKGSLRRKPLPAATRGQYRLIQIKWAVHSLQRHCAPARAVTGQDMILEGNSGKCNTKVKPRTKCRVEWTWRQSCVLFWYEMLLLVNHFAFLEYHPVSWGYITVYVFLIADDINRKFRPSPWLSV